jgi:DNA-binding MarR family transcriptional regulator
MDITTVRRFRENIRHVERELNLQDNANCCQGVTLAQCHTLLGLQEHKFLNLSELSEILCLDKSTVSRTIESLVKCGLVNRSIPDENRRKVVLSLTERGTGICNQINRENDTYFRDLLDSIPEKDLPVFLRSFDTLVKKMVEKNRDKQATCSP